jgi:hypothetical protein
MKSPNKNGPSTLKTSVASTSKKQPGSPSPKKKENSSPSQRRKKNKLPKVVVEVNGKNFYFKPSTKALVQS